MKILLAKSAGFCFGVKRAIEIACETAADKKGNIYTLGPLIHNRHVIKMLGDYGIKETNDIEEIPPDSTLIIRTHGVSADIYRRLDEKGIQYIDATCPYVKKIHKIVHNYHNKGYKIIIFGNENHPEVKGINGWCNYSAFITEDPVSIEKIAIDDKTCIVAQTTSSKEIWGKIKKNAKTSCKDVLIFDTICKATYERQAEAKDIAQKSDCMVIIGGFHSSNTKKLYDECRKVCEKTYLIESASELPKSVFDTCIAGVTAGASTPEWIIKEVISIMSEEKAQGELSFVEELDKSLVDPKTGDIVKGTVIGITPTEVYVDIGFKADGVIPIDQITSDPDADIEQILKVGDEIEAFVYRVSDVEGTVGLSIRKLEAIEGRKKLESAMETKEVLKGTIAEAVNGGVIIRYNDARVFVPASLASLRYLKDLNTLVGQEVPFRVIEINRRRRKIIGSIKSVLQEEKERQLNEFWENAEVGKVYDGIVKSLTDFGAFVDIGGIDGLVHISELSWERIKHPSEVLNVGDKIKVFIIDMDKGKNKVSLGFKRKEDNPWIKAQEMFNVGDIVNAKIVRLVSFGAFAQLLPTVDGLIHISQISTERIPKVSSVLSVGQEVTAKITNIDWENKKISLSIRALLEQDAAAKKAQEPEQQAEAEVAEQTEETEQQVEAETAEQAQEPEQQVESEAAEQTEETEQQAEAEAVEQTEEPEQQAEAEAAEQAQEPEQQNAAEEEESGKEGIPENETKQAAHEDAQRESEQPDSE